MVQTTTFGAVIGFLEQLGVYDIILPFLLVFTVVYAIFEKTRVFGTEKVEGEEYPRRNLNAMVAFVIAFLVIASSQLVAIINEALANFVLLLLLIVCFLVLMGTFYSEKEEVVLKGGWRTFFSILVFIGILLIFLNAVKTTAGKSWLSYFIDYLRYNFSSTAVAGIVLVIVVVLFMWFIVKDPNKSTNKETKKEE
ncbi:hypothetical protein HN695_06525 [Candidatus Woesearchaeota archaeon]|jgi:hypothetical protein|nr:hypothetical protein [Candidatus Woesearchaeota archaeon]MBT5272839.1 hypothetical protein [Candidatus Woesearchaeota archaeon]MBT6040451.1 hypothetical protein [Candidatus Woesearchaeota archaeon]MBT6336458.1 hypothetical protein [Candidatus Woesearchaeota archaeon]MBT7927962.1 hypothetical protein [Candidatus Woesearchaeota archaeon]